MNILLVLNTKPMFIPPMIIYGNPCYKTKNAGVKPELDLDADVDASIEAVEITVASSSSRYQRNVISSNSSSNEEV